MYRYNVTGCGTGCGTGAEMDCDGFAWSLEDEQALIVIDSKATAAIVLVDFLMNMIIILS